MVRELSLAWQSRQEEQVPHGIDLELGPTIQGQAHTLSSCEHRTVSKDGRIVCSKIIEGDNEVSPNICRSCPYKLVNCAHLRFSLSQTLSSPLIVRYNGRTEVWDDDPPELEFERAACTARVMPIYEPRSCSGCTLRQSVQPTVQEPRRRRQAAAVGKVVPFPSHEALAATG
jgi:hypothetical protein